MSKEANEVYNWDESNKNILKEHLEYYESMIAYIENLRKEGPMVFTSKKPTSKLPNLSIIMGVPRKFKNNTSSRVGNDLHKYLKKKISKDDYKEPKEPEKKTFENLIDYLKDYANYEKTFKKSSLKFHYNHGKLLEKFYGFWFEKKELKDMCVLIGKHGKNKTLKVVIVMQERKEKLHDLLKTFWVLNMFLLLLMNFVQKEKAQRQC